MPETKPIFGQEDEGGNARPTRFLHGLCATLAWATLALVVLTRVPTQADAANPDRQLGANLVYRVPAGYSAVAQPAGVLMLRDADLAQGKITGFLLAVPEIPLDTATTSQIEQVGRPAFAQALAVAAGNIASDPNARVGNAEHLSGETYRVETVSFDKGAGQQRHSRFEIDFVAGAIHIFLATGYGTPAALRAQLPGLAMLRASARYRNQGAPAPANVPPLPNDLAALVQPPPRETPQQGKQCRIVQRQVCSGGIGTSLGYFCNTYPQQVCD